LLTFDVYTGVFGQYIGRFGEINNAKILSPKLIFVNATVGFLDNLPSSDCTSRYFVQWNSFKETE